MRLKISTSKHTIIILRLEFLLLIWALTAKICSNAHTLLESIYGSIWHQKNPNLRARVNKQVKFPGAGLKKKYCVIIERAKGDLFLEESRICIGLWSDCSKLTASSLPFTGYALALPVCSGPYRRPLTVLGSRFSVLGSPILLFVPYWKRGTAKSWG